MFSRRIPHVAATFTNFIRPDAPTLIVTAALGQLKRSATNPMSSSFAFPSTGAAFNLANQVPSGFCSSEDTLARGFTFI
jgi:hypothetical protein